MTETTGKAIVTPWMESQTGVTEEEECELISRIDGALAAQAAEHEALLYQYRACHQEKDEQAAEIARLREAGNKWVGRYADATARAERLEQALRDIQRRHVTGQGIYRRADGRCGCPDCHVIAAALADTPEPTPDNRTPPRGS
jgi:hypothetical protein